MSETSVIKRPEQLPSLRCSCCAAIWVGTPAMPRYLGPATARWIGPPPNRVVDLLCQHCLDIWLDNADDDSDLEPTNVVWLEAHRG